MSDGIEVCMHNLVRLLREFDEGEGDVGGRGQG